MLEPNANRFQGLVLTNATYEQVQVIQSFRGTEIVDWHPLAVRVFRDDRASKKLPVGDFPSLASSMPVFSQRACDVLKEILEGSGQLLPLACDEGKYFAFNVTNLCDAFDKNASQVTELPGGGIIMVQKYVLFGSRIKDEPIFKVPETAVLHVFVNQRFKDIVDSNNLKGFLFERVEVID